MQPEHFDTLQRALELAQNGVPVFPCSPQTKAPLVDRGLYAATANERIVRRWWQDHPDAMIGVPTGARSDVWVLDVDLKDNGPDNLASLEAMHGALPETLIVATASGGRHYYWRHVPGVRNRGRLAAGIDVRGDGGYIIAAGSVRDDGTYYEIEHDATPADAPQWLLDLVIKRDRSVLRSPMGSEAQPHGNARYVEAAIAGEIEKLVSTRAGRNNALNDAAFSLGTLVGAGGMSRHDAETRLFAAAVANGYVGKDGEAAARATIASGLQSGEASPREIPEGNDRQFADGIEAWIPHKLIEKARATRLGLDVAPAAATKEELAAEPEPPETIFRATPFTLRDPRLLPRREFVYGTHLIRKYVSVTVAPGGLGKTSLTIAEALAMVSGRALLGTPVLRPLRVWLFNAEDPREEMERRLTAAALHYRIRAEDIDGRLFLDTGREQNLIVAHDDRKGIKINAPVLDAVVDEIEKHRIDVMVIDPFVSTHGVNENDNGAIDRVAKLWGQIADITNCAIEVVHHVRKSDGRDITVEDARGAISLLAAARSARVLNRMTEEEAHSAGLTPQDRFAHFSVTRGKANLAPMSAGSEWRRLVSVPLGNGEGVQRPQDHAAVVTEWKWPSSDDIVAELSNDQIASIKHQLVTSDFKAAHNAKPWAGEAVAFVLGLDLDVQGERKRAASILKSLEAEGHVVRVDQRDPISRKVMRLVRPAETENEGAKVPAKVVRK
jgi:hypothetical protein